MKTLYLHIGTPKTATSSLQRFMDLNQELLHTCGISYQKMPFSYPNVSDKRNAHFLVGPSIDSSPDPEGEALYRDRLAEGFRQIHAQFDDCDTVFLTDENLWWGFHYTKEDPLQALLDDAAAAGYSVKILVYLRRQDTLHVSRWNQSIKSLRSDSTFEEYLDKLFTRRPLMAYYDQALDRIAARIGKENILVRRFQPSSWPEGSIYLDFMAALGLDQSLSFVFPKKEANPGLKNNFVEIQRRINKNSHLCREEKQTLCNYVKKASNKSSEHEEYGILSSEEARQFLNEFKEGNDRIAKDYIKDGQPLFSDEIKETGKWLPDNEYMGEDVAALLSSVTADLNEKKKLKHELKSTRFCFKQTLRNLRRHLRTGG